MRKLIVYMGILGLIFVVSSLAVAGNTAQQTVSFSTQPINEITLSGSNYLDLTATTATAGHQPSEVSDSSTTYSITTNERNKKITGHLNFNMPSYAILKINLEAPTGATSAGDVALSTTPANLVTGISNVSEVGKTITYKFSATVEGGMWFDERIVTLTLSDGS
jgi:hypothetical protein